MTALCDEGGGRGLLTATCLVPGAPRTPTNLLSEADLLVSRTPRLGSHLPSSQSGQGPYTFCALKEVTLVVSSGSTEGTALS